MGIPGCAPPPPLPPPHTLALAAALTQPSPNLLVPERPRKFARAADPANPAIDWSSRRSFEGDIRFAAGGSAPANPRGRTGMHGRGLLGKWGPNHAADPIVTRFDPSRPDQLQVVAIKRKDTGDWALPGGMVDSGETVSLTVKREFEEEAGNLAIYPEQQALFKNPDPQS
jgi:ADP-ribose pyrophosphatase